MKKTDVQVGRHYKAKVSGNEVPILITGELPSGGWEARNVNTGKSVRIKSAQRLRAAVPQLDGPAPAAKRVMTKAEYEADAKGRTPAVDVGPTATKSAKAARATKEAAKRHTGQRDAKGEARKLSILDAVVKVLQERNPSDGPLTCPQMLERMTAKGYWSPARGGRTPANTLSAAMRREIKAKGDASRFRFAERGKFALNR